MHRLANLFLYVYMKFYIFNFIYFYLIKKLFATKWSNTTLAKVADPLLEKCSLSRSQRLSSLPSFGSSARPSITNTSPVPTSFTPCFFAGSCRIRSFNLDLPSAIRWSRRSAPDGGTSRRRRRQRENYLKSTTDISCSN